jgi:hypothetical protein
MEASLVYQVVKWLATSTVTEIVSDLPACDAVKVKSALVTSRGVE